MFEKELTECQNLTLYVNKAIADFYDNTDENNKRHYLEVAVTKLSLLLTFLVQFRHQVLLQQQTMTSSQKIIANNLLNELKIQQDAFKSVSYNLTAIMYTSKENSQ